MGLDRDEFAGFTAAAGRVQVLSTSMRISDLSIQKQPILSYLQSISPDKQELERDFDLFREIPYFTRASLPKPPCFVSRSSHGLSPSLK